MKTMIGTKGCHVLTFVTTVIRKQFTNPCDARNVPNPIMSDNSPYRIFLPLFGADRKNRDQCSCGSVRNHP